MTMISMNFNDFRCLFYKRCWWLFGSFFLYLFVIFRSWKCCHKMFQWEMSSNVIKDPSKWPLDPLAFGRPRKSTSLPSLPSEFTATSQTPSCPSSSSRPDGRNGFSRRDWCHEVSWSFQPLWIRTWVYVSSIYIIYIYMYDNPYPYLYWFYALWGNLQFAILLLLPGMTWIKQRFFVVMASDW